MCRRVTLCVRVALCVLKILCLFLRLGNNYVMKNNYSKISGIIISPEKIKNGATNFTELLAIKSWFFCIKSQNGVRSK